MVWILGRTYCTGTPEDYKACHAIMDKYSLVPLSAYGKPYTPPAGKVDPTIDMKTPVREQVNSMDAGRLLQAAGDADEGQSAGQGRRPDGREDGEDRHRAGQGFRRQQAPRRRGQSRMPEGRPRRKIMGHFKSAGTDLNGWIFTTKTGVYGTDYLQRALVTAIGLGANRPQDAVYPTSEVDGDGKPYSGANKYVMHFAKGQTPPVDAFWSITMYNADYFFVDNPLNKYTVSPRNNLKYNADGSLDLYIQNESPGKDKEANWLPAPKGKFILMMRLYWPKEKDPSIIDGTWKPPPVKIAAK